MKQNWKRSAAALGLTLTMILPIAEAVSIIPCLGVPPVPIGTVVDHVLYTDITADIDGQLVPTYCITGKTVVAAEDLLDYGFDVVWDNGSRTLEISLNTDGKEITADYNVEENIHPIGAVAGDVLSTDIVTGVRDYWGRYYDIPSWNIGNKTVVDMDDLAKAFAYDYSWDQGNRRLSLYSKRYTGWGTVNLSAPEQAERLTRGFTVKAVRGEDGTFQVEGEGCWGAVDNLSVSATGLSFVLYQRVYEYDGCLSGLEKNATVAPWAGKTWENKLENTRELQAEVDKFIRVYVDGDQKKGEIWLGKGNGHQDYEFKFDYPVSGFNKIEVVVGDATWVADYAIPHDWEYDFISGLPGTCERYTTEQAHIYNCSKPGLHGGSTALYVVWTDGTTRELLSEMTELGMFAMSNGYYAQDVTVSVDGTYFTFRCPVYELYASDNDPYSGNYTLEDKGMGTYRVDLVTRELTLESIAD
ncbi:MAG: hypothetical protein HFF18_02640 [Oscillospiraceae bacterium]|nr:hypothetical protein [Oscillospiraceae bacterium]